MEKIDLFLHNRIWSSVNDPRIGLIFTPKVKVDQDSLIQAYISGQSKQDYTYETMEEGREFFIKTRREGEMSSWTYKFSKITDSCFELYDDEKIICFIANDEYFTSRHFKC